MCLLLFSCKTKYVPVETTITKTETVRDTVINVQLEKEYIHVSVPDTISFLETKYAESTAIWHGGTSLLEHSISNKDVPIEVQLQYIDRETVKEVQIPYEVIKEVNVEKDLTKWQKLRINIGNVLLIALSVVIIIFVFKRTNIGSKIINLFKTIFKL